MRGAMLQRLEFADDLAELLALLEVIDGHVHRPPGHADTLGSRADAARHQHGIEHGAAAVDFTDHGIAVEFDIVESDMAGHRTVDQAYAVVAHAGGVLRHGEERDAVRVAITARGARGNDDHLAAGTVENEVLAARQLEPVARLFRAAADPFGAVLGAFVDRYAIDFLARNQPGQPAALYVVAAMLERGGGQHGGGHERRRRQVAADLLEHDIGFDLAHAEPAIVFVHEHSREAHFGELLPQRMAETILAVAVAPMAQLVLDRAFLGHELASGIGQHRLVVIIVKRHRSGSRKLEDSFGNDVQHDF